MTQQPPDLKTTQKLPLGGGRLSMRFRRMNIAVFASVLLIMSAILMLMFNRLIATISSEYATQFALSSSEALSARIAREVGIVSTLAHSESVVEWMLDEFDEEKKTRAFVEMQGVLAELYSFNLYIGLESSFNAYIVESGASHGDAWSYEERGLRNPTNTWHFGSYDRLDPSNPNDVWFFASISSGTDYVLNIGIDHVTQRKRVWIDYNVYQDGRVLGVISTGLDFSHVVGELFAHYDSNHIRGLIIGMDGAIHMDSSLIGDRDFLYSDFISNISQEFRDSGALEVIEAHLSAVDGRHDENDIPETTNLQHDRYSFITVAPVRATDWSVVILSAGASMFDITYFVPALVSVVALLVLVAVIASVSNYRLIFMPLGKLTHSLASLHEDANGSVYGTERDDELGELSRTIQELFKKSNIDALTGIYNRRFMESNLEQIMGMLSRSGGMLSALMLDIDFFKKFNDTYGHDRGDECLREVARAISDGVPRTADFVARYGGEEFIAILTNTGEAGARLVAEKLLENVRGLEIPHTGNAAAPYVTVSIGVTTGSVVYDECWLWEDFVRRADEALYMSKENGRNMYTFLEMRKDG